MLADLSTLDLDILVDDAEDTGLTAGSEGLMDKNLLFTSGVLVAAGTGVAGAALLLSAMPAQVIGATALSGGLMYAGQRKHEGKSILPWTEQAATPAPAPDAPVPAPAPVTNRSGDEVDIEGL